MAEGQTNDPGAPGIAIGASLKEARQRIGMGVKEAEERTKIRARYLRALEAEDWEALPGSAYVRGFLRTYGSLLGLDGGMLADEYRRRFEATSPATSSIAGEPMRSARNRQNGGDGPSRGLVAGGVIVLIVLLLVVLGVLGSGDDSPDSAAGPNVARDGKGGGGKGGGSSRDRNQRFRLTIEPASPMTICLATGGDALIDSQVLAAGASEEFRGNRKYRMDLADAGEISIGIDGEDQEIAGSGEQSFEITSSGVDEVSFAGPGCP